MDKETVEALRQVMREEIQEALQPINSRLDGIDSRLNVIEKGQADLQENQVALQRSQAEQAEFERGTRILLEANHKNVKLLAEAQSVSMAKLQQIDRVEATLNDVKSDTEVIKDVVTWHSSDIKRQKQA